MAKWQDLVLELSESKTMHEKTRNTEPTLGAQTIIAGTTRDEMILKAKRMNERGERVAVAYLGEFVHSRRLARTATEEWLRVIDDLVLHDIDGYISIKLSQLGLDIEEAFCYGNVEAIVQKAAKHNIYVSFDMEDYTRLQGTYDIYDMLKEKYNNLSAEVQAHLYRSEDDIVRYDNVPLRIVKGSFDERIAVAFQTEEEIIEQFQRLVEHRLQNGQYTIIAAQDREIVDFVKQYVAEHHIDKSTFEFQFLFGLNEQLRDHLRSQGYRTSVFIPYGEDWYAYYMRRLAEHPEHLKLVQREVVNKKTITIASVIAGAFALGLWLGRRK